MFCKPIHEGDTEGRENNPRPVMIPQFQDTGLSSSVWTQKQMARCPHENPDERLVPNTRTLTWALSGVFPSTDRWWPIWKLQLRSLASSQWHWGQDLTLEVLSIWRQISLNGCDPSWVFTPSGDRNRLWLPICKLCVWSDVHNGNTVPVMHLASSQWWFPRPSSHQGLPSGYKSRRRWPIV